MKTKYKILAAVAVYCFLANAAQAGIWGIKGACLQSGTAFGVDIVSNILELNVEAPSLYVKPSENVVVDMDVRNLLQRVNACQAMLGYNSTYLNAGSVLPGGGVWDLVIYQSWAVSGEVDAAIGVDAYGAIGTDANGTIAKVNLTAGSTEGTTKLIFRPDAIPDPGLVKSTFLSDMSANIVWPAKFDSQNIVIDGTLPVIDINSVRQGNRELLISSGSSFSGFKGAVNIKVTASDSLAGLSGPPDVNVTPYGGSVQDAVFLTELPLGTFNYTWDINSSTPNGIATITASLSDKSGNFNSAVDYITVNTCCWACIVDFDDLSRFTDQWLQSGADLEADFDGNTTVDFKDFTYLAYLWMEPCPSGWPWY